MFSSPSLVEGKVYVGSNDGHVYALDGNRRTPAQAILQPQAVSIPAEEAAEQDATEFIWRNRIESSNAPTVVDGTIYIGSDDGFLYLLDAAGGEVLRRQNVGSNPGSAPVVVEGAIYVATTDGFLRALDSTSLEPLWQYNTGDDNGSAPVIADGVVYAGSKDGHAYAIDAASGEMIWRFRPDPVARTGPAVAGGLVFTGS